MRLAVFCLMLAQLGVPASESITDKSSTDNGSVFVWWVAPALLKVRPSDRPPASPQQVAEISAAQNEFEPFQIILHSPKQLAGLDVQASPLTDDNGNAIASSSIQVYLVRGVDVKRPSRMGGQIGEWPDILLPRVDMYFHERRNAFPFQLAEGRNQPVWIDVYVPSGTRAGVYRGKVSVTVEGKDFLTVPVRLNVRNFALPSTASLATSFGFNGLAALKQHAGQYTSDDDIRALTMLYSKAALLDRISLHGGSMIPPSFSISGNTAAIDWKLYDQEVGPLLDGTVLGEKDPLPRARATSVEMRTHASADTNDKKMLYWREWAKHFRSRGWLDRLFDYVLDEPRVEDYPKVVELGRLAHQADPAIRTLVTLQKTAMLEGSIDLWSPLINCFEAKPGPDTYCRETVTRDKYDDTPPEKKLWWYQSCASHGCNIEGGAYFKGWPSYMIDDSAVSNRVMPWLAWKYRINGELYFNTDEAYSQSKDPWTDVYLFGGNGDGTLFYPGRTAQIGGSRDIPIDSVRLKLIREGLEDYEYLVLLEHAAGRDAVARQVDRVVQNLYSFTGEPSVLGNARLEIGNEIESRLPAGNRGSTAGDGR
jgi:hypothetical protein